MTGRQQEEVTTGVSLTCRLCLVDLLPTHDLVYQSNGSMATNTTGHCLCKTGVELTNKADRGTDPSQLLTGEEVDRMARGQAAQTHNIPVQKYTTKNPQVTTTINKQINNTYNVK